MSSFVFLNGGSFIKLFCALWGLVEKEKKNNALFGY
jgi:hypothetical protein